MTIFRGFYLLAFTFFISCSFIKQPKPSTLLKVGDKSWDLNSYKKNLELEIKNISPEEKKSKKDFQKIKSNLIQDLIFNALIENWAKKNKVRILPVKTSPLKIHSFSSQKVSTKDLQRLKKEKLLYKALLSHLSKKTKQPSIKSQKTYYSKNKKQFYKPSSCFLKQILVSSESLSKKLLLKIKAGSSFDKLQYLHTKKADIGWVEAKSLDIFDQACRQSLNSVSPVLKSPYGFHIFKILKKRDGRQRKFYQAQKEILKILTKKSTKKLFQAWLKKETSKTSIFINENLLDKIHIQYKSNML